MVRKVKAGGGRASPSRARGGGRTRSPKDQRGGTAQKRTAESRSGAARRRTGASGAKGGKPAGKQSGGPGGRTRRVTKAGKTPRSAGGPMATREERKRHGELPAREGPPEDVGGRAPVEGKLATEGVSMRAEQDAPSKEQRRRSRSPSKASPTAKPRAQGGHGGKEPKHGPEVEPLMPGGEIGETRDMGAGGSAAEQPGRAPATRIVEHGAEERGGRPGRATGGGPGEEAGRRPRH
jgi:hypothetical protein